MTHPSRAENGMPYSNVSHDQRAAKPTLGSRTAEQVHGILRAAETQAVELRRQIETRVRNIEDEALRSLDEAKARSDALLSARLDQIVQFSTVVEECAERVISLIEEGEQIKAELQEAVGILREGLPGSSPRPGASLAESFAVAANASAAPPPFQAIADSLPPAADPPPGDDGIHLFALQLALQGATRSDVAQRISDEFGIHHAEAILDDVFGAGTPGSHCITKPGLI